MDMCMKIFPDPEKQAQERKRARATSSGQAEGGWTGGACAKEVSVGELAGAIGGSFKESDDSNGASAAEVAVQQ
jgi:hypothetical protein